MLTTLTTIHKFAIRDMMVARENGAFDAVKGTGFVIRVDLAGNSDPGSHFATNGHNTAFDDSEDQHSLHRRPLDLRLAGEGRAVAHQSRNGFARSRTG